MALFSQQVKYQIMTLFNFRLESSDVGRQVPLTHCFPIECNVIDTLRR